MRQAIGLETPGGADWAGIHGQQYALLQHRVTVRVAIHVVAFALVAAALHATLSIVFLGVWGAALAVALGAAARADLSLCDADNRQVSCREMKRTRWLTAVKAGVWAVATVACAIVAPLTATQLLWTVCAVLVLASTASRYSAPLSSIAFAAVVGLGGVLAGLVTFDWTLACIAALTTFLASFGIVESARVAVSARMAEQAMQEKSEVVSMLLREFAEGQADWLWQVDTRRRLQAVSPRFAFALGKDPREAEGQSFLQLISGEGWKTGHFPQSLHELADRLKRKENFSNLMVTRLGRGTSAMVGAFGHADHRRGGQLPGLPRGRVRRHRTARNLRRRSNISRATTR